MCNVKQCRRATQVALSTLARQQAECQQQLAQSDALFPHPAQLKVGPSCRAHYTLPMGRWMLHVHEFVLPRAVASRCCPSMRMHMIGSTRQAPLEHPILGMQAPPEVHAGWRRAARIAPTAIKHQHHRHHCYHHDYHQLLPLLVPSAAMRFLHASQLLCHSHGHLNCS